MLTSMYVRTKNWMASDEGATATEYGILVAVIAFALIAGAIVFGDALSAYFDKIGGVVNGWEPGAVTAP